MIYIHIALYIIAYALLFMLYCKILRPYLQCWRCEKPFGCLQSMLLLYLRVHLWRRVRVRVRLRARDLFGMSA